MFNSEKLFFYFLKSDENSIQAFLNKFQSIITSPNFETTQLEIKTQFNSLFNETKSTSSFDSEKLYTYLKNTWDDFFKLYLEFIFSPEEEILNILSIYSYLQIFVILNNLAKEKAFPLKTDEQNTLNNLESLAEKYLKIFELQNILNNEINQELIHEIENLILETPSNIFDYLESDLKANLSSKKNQDSKKIFPNQTTYALEPKASQLSFIKLTDSLKIENFQELKLDIAFFIPINY